MKTGIIYIIILTSFLLFSTNLYSQKYISLQGVLKDASGDPLTDGNYSVEFKFYTTLAGGSSVWSETQTVAVSGGVFSAHLGSVSALSISFENQYWVGISVEGEPELSPRIMLSYSPYAMYAVAIADDAVTSDKIVDGTITAADLSQMGATTGQNLQWNGISWQPTDTPAESDPLFSASAASAIAASDVSNWNTAYSWGDHSIIGYLTSESDPTFSSSAASAIAASDVSNWNTAYSWGDHSTEGYMKAGNAAGGSLSGTYPNPTIANDAITSTQIADGSIAAADFSSMGASANDILQYNGSSWQTESTISLIGIDDLSDASHDSMKGSIFLGKGAGVSNYGSGNTAVGASALYSNTSGASNTAIGTTALYSNTTGSSNTASGQSALNSNTTGSSNTAIGRFALKSNTSGSNNTGSGTNTLRYNTTGSDNTASGYHALYSNTSGERNTASGAYALQSNTTGDNNTAHGTHALNSNIFGTHNTASGAYALSFNTIGVGNTASGTYALRYNTTGDYNTTSGYNALSSNISGTHNTASGASALASNTTGNYNTANGSDALKANTSGSRNTASGFRALYSNTTGQYNTANGTYSLYSNTTASFNTASGYNALSANTSGDNNTANGAYALFSNTTGKGNTASGRAALSSNTYGYNNTAIGDSALSSSTSGYSNTASGSGALQSNTTGDGNTASGRSALQSNTTGGGNTASGRSALQTNTTGSNNTASGIKSLYSNTSGYYNTASGFEALRSNTTGSRNTASGYEALYSNTTGADNTAIGCDSGPITQNNQQCTFLGYNAANNSFTSRNRSMALGTYSRISASYQVRIGDGSITSIGGYAGWTNLSDGRFKTDVVEAVPGMDFISKLRPVTYRMKVRELNRFLNIPDSLMSDEINQAAIANKESITYTGFIAQEVEAAARSLGYDFSGVDAPKNDEDTYGLRYAEFVVPLVKAMQEQQEVIEAQNKRIAELENGSSGSEDYRAENQVLRQEMMEIRSQLDELKRLITTAGEKKE